jgi:DNA-binding NtrC family response regulator
LVIDADEALSRTLITRFELEGFNPQPARNRVQASALLRSLRFSAILSEIQLPDGDGEGIFRDAQPFLGSTPFIFTAAPGNIDQVVRLVKAGADYITKPYDISALVERLRSLMTKLVQPEKPSSPEPIALSPAMSDLDRRVRMLAPMNVNALVTGESGSGKEVIVRHIHRLSSRAGKPFVAVACATLGSAEGERILFGERNSSADNGQWNAGALEQAGQGTLFLDDIEEMPPTIQSRLAQVIDDGKFHRVGDAVGFVNFEARLIAGAHIAGATLRAKLRPALFHRLAVVEMEVPPLRERRADIEPLANSLLRDVARDLALPPRRIDAGAMAALRAFDWPGNVRELRNRLVRAASFASGEVIRAQDLFPEHRREESLDRRKETLEEVRSRAERQRITEALSRFDGRIADTAQSLGISRVTLWSKMKRLGLPSGPRDRFKPSGDGSALRC